YHEYFTIHVPQLGAGIDLGSDRLFFNGAAGQEGPGGAFLTQPSVCGSAAGEPFRMAFATTLHADSAEEEAPEDEYDVLAPTFPPPGFLAGAQELVSYLPKAAE